MPEISVQGVTVRTTSDGAGHPHMVVAGSAAAPEDALADLAGAAEAAAGRVAQELSGRRENHDRPDAEWRFEVVDVRMIAGRLQSGSFSDATSPLTGARGVHRGSSSLAS
jgi:hypothetical protein